MSDTQPNPHTTIGLWTALTAIAIVGSTLVGAGWVAGRAYLQDVSTIQGTMHNDYRTAKGLG